MGESIVSTGGEWDYLIILDACRYDYFARLHGVFLEGFLEEKWSPGTDTWTWCRRVLKGSHGDTIYVSSNPYIGSRTALRGCRAGEWFREVVDVWDYGWDDELGTVPPWIVVQEALKRLDSAPRMIVHFMQPHAPYLSPKYRAPGFPRPVPGRSPVLRGVRGFMPSGWARLARTVASLSWRLRLIRHPWPLLEALGLPPSGPMDAVRRLYGINGLREAYEENLEIVLGYVALLASSVFSRFPEASIIVTSDHGELLGEDGLFGHGFNHPYVRRVPWLRVSGVRRVPVDAWKHVAPAVIREALRKRLEDTGAGPCPAGQCS